MVAESQEDVKLALARVVALRETGQIEVFNRQGERFRAWLWPLDSPEVAVCLLGTLVPASLALLTDRERECLEWLAKGTDTREIAERLGVSLSTVHTHMRRARERLDLPSVEALISFAARYCYPANRPLDAESGQS
jgi:DNA-binding CsgD family transcriptional regulator